jgi:hypothetical protein
MWATDYQSPQNALVFCCWVTKHLLILSVWWSWEEKGHGEELVGKIHPLLWALGNKWICKFEIGGVGSLCLYFPFLSLHLQFKWLEIQSQCQSFLVKLLSSWMRTYWSASLSQRHGCCYEVVCYHEFTISILLTTIVSCSRGQKHFLIFSKCSKSR